jgi:hypothetical protein
MLRAAGKSNPLLSFGSKTAKGHSQPQIITAQMEMVTKRLRLTL